MSGPGPVECRSDHTYAQRPSAIWWQGQRLEVIEILAEWRTPQGKHFRANTTEGVFELVYQEPEAAWTIHQL